MLSRAILRSLGTNVGYFTIDYSPTSKNHFAPTQHSIYQSAEGISYGVYPSVHTKCSELFRPWAPKAGQQLQLQASQSLSIRGSMTSNVPDCGWLTLKSCLPFSSFTSACTQALTESSLAATHMTQERWQTRPKSMAQVASLHQSLGLLIQRHASCMGPWWAAYLKLLKLSLYPCAWA